ncbi:9650_t:CDS:2 [Acaulospora morrowiae]|uniref:9650_t:CDS:1 n=1 Tax=Acaulospora morrowiae TaxID=94023 RepID=A0A9N9FD66_9GLOM|nr:9650_t:CDS:2 [Acaulospora morrowiae]
MNHTSQQVIEVPENFEMVDINHLTHMIADMLDRLIAHNDQIPLTPSSISRFHSRARPSISVSDYLCRIVGGITTQELNTLELEFLPLIDWQLICTKEILQQYYVNLVNQNPNYRRFVSSESEI